MMAFLDSRVVGGVAFEKLLDAHHSELHRFIQRVVSRMAADDLSVETFLRAFRDRRSRPVDLDSRAWLFTIATRLCRSHFRRERCPPAPSVGDDSRDPLEAIVRRLPVSQRLAFTMRRFHDLG